ncbi:MAG: NAD(P)H nitroreductase [Peptococcaceae bacterium]|nr:NAD(P)H nitroreductase [Candidatus Syntrophopropionicum ammoniitolerans]
MYELLKTRRSIRKFQDKIVGEDKLDTILKCVLMAPSSRSSRHCEFVAVTERELLKKLSASRTMGTEFLAGTGAAIVVLADPGKSDVWIEDASIAALTIQLVAHSLGLGSCWSQIRERLTPAGRHAEDHVKDVLNIPDRFKVLCIIGLGYPAEEKPPYDEADLPLDKLHRNQY